jgi:hypothetical protein
MKSLITQDMVDGFNEIMEEMGGVVRLKFHTNDVEIVLPEDGFIDSYILNLNNKFYEILEEFFKERCGISELIYNNTKSVFWAFE